MLALVFAPAAPSPRSRSQRCRASVALPGSTYTYDLTPLAGHTLVHRVTVDAKQAAAQLTGMPLDGGMSLSQLARAAAEAQAAHRARRGVRRRDRGGRRNETDGRRMQQVGTTGASLLDALGKLGSSGSGAAGGISGGSGSGRAVSSGGSSSSLVASAASAMLPRVMSMLGLSEPSQLASATLDPLAGMRGETTGTLHAAVCSAASMARCPRSRAAAVVHLHTRAQLQSTLLSYLGVGGALEKALKRGAARAGGCTPLGARGSQLIAPLDATAPQRGVLVNYTSAEACALRSGATVGIAYAIECDPPGTATSPAAVSTATGTGRTAAKKTPWRLTAPPAWDGCRWSLRLAAAAACPTRHAGAALCAPGCPRAWRGDGICDAACLAPACGGDDGGDCVGDGVTVRRQHRSDQPLCAAGCLPAMANDGKCDRACDNAACRYDGVDCYNAWTAEQRHSRRDAQLAAAAAAAARRGQLRESAERHAATRSNGRLREAEAVPGASSSVWPSASSSSTASSLQHADAAADLVETLKLATRAATAMPTKAETAICAWRCPPSFLGDGRCDDGCDTPACDHDRGDCLAMTPNPHAAGSRVPPPATLVARATPRRPPAPFGQEKEEEEEEEEGGEVTDQQRGEMAAARTATGATGATEAGGALAATSEAAGPATTPPLRGRPVPCTYSPPESGATFDLSPLRLNMHALVMQGQMPSAAEVGSIRSRGSDLRAKLSQAAQGAFTRGAGDGGGVTGGGPTMLGGISTLMALKDASTAFTDLTRRAGDVLDRSIPSTRDLHISLCRDTLPADCEGPASPALLQAADDDVSRCISLGRLETQKFAPLDAGRLHAGVAVRYSGGAPCGEGGRLSRVIIQIACQPGTSAGTGAGAGVNDLVPRLEPLPAGPDPCLTTLRINSSAGCPIFGTVVPGRCAPACDAAWLDDGECDDECNSPDCNHDGGDCYDFRQRRARPEAAQCSRGCMASWPGDGSCDEACNVAACGWDRGDCSGPWPLLRRLVGGYGAAALALSAGLLVLCAVGVAVLAWMATLTHERASPLGKHQPLPQWEPEEQPGGGDALREADD